MATPEQYLSAFELHGDGYAVLDDLQRLFCQPPFKAGQPDQTAYNCGARAVVEHIWSQVEAAKRPKE